MIKKFELNVPRFCLLVRVIAKWLFLGTSEIYFVLEGMVLK